MEETFQLAMIQDSLILELQRLHTYQALSSSAYLALTTSDPISSAFVLRDELYQLASQEKQFKEEYSELAVKCMEFAVSCIDLCRTSDEVHCLLRGDFDHTGYDQKHPLETVKIAIRSREKKFVAHSNCQHQLENLFYNPMFCIRDFEGMQRFQFLLIFLPLLPLLYFIYLFFPKFRMPLPQALIFRDRGSIKYELATILRCPVIKFVGYMVSYVTFLILITVATFRLDRNDLVDEEANWERRSMEIWSYDFRTNNVVMTKIQIILLFWILGQLGMECKQVYYFGLRYFFRSYYNVMDWAGIAIYLASYSLRIIVDFKVQSALTMYRDELRTAHELLNNATRTGIHVGPGFDVHTDTDYVNYRNHILLPSSAYWLRGCRLWWAPDDPEYVSDCLFALGNVLSFARISHLMPAWELLGPLQISLARMVTDIIRFMALFSVMVIAFVVGLTNLYWYFANILITVDIEERVVRYASGIPAFRSTGATFYTLYWALFGQSSNNVTTIDTDLAKDYPGHQSLAVDSSPFMINSLGSILYAIYNACMTIILLNMLIAMMSKSFDEIQGDRLEEWKFARASLWMVYIDQEGVLPPPLNLLPSREALSSSVGRFRASLKRNPTHDSPGHGPKDRHKGGGISLRSTVWKNQYLNTKNELSDELPPSNLKKTITTTTVSTGLDCSPVHSDSWDSQDEGEDEEGEPKKAIGNLKEFTDTMRANVLRRYLFKLQKQKEAESKAGELSLMNYQRQQNQKAMDAMQGDMSRRDSKGGHRGSDAGSTHSRGSAEEAQAADGNRLRGLSSLLMPPSVRRKLEAVAVASGTESDRDGRAAAEAVARYYLLETTRKDKTGTGPPITQRKRSSAGSWNANSEDMFTARTERPLKGAHLRELYRVEQEMHDMSDALSSHSISEATISEINELERI
ncbi:Short transient receptor putative channel 6 [Clonorchis sinensis]|uniref:Short transient receptor putative channel 6 n=1 Tax=Clonorchis sinensis TaxID=79923 RepID=A0A8T1M6T6_CLOSI|nr:Short transient receptor putative channel 6 [Clonorchis sinensis]